ncbi:MAG: hypothetical protein ABIS69_05345 [Sediminibacterium sp.]
MRSLLTFACVFILTGGYSQYYFNDMVTTQLSNDQYKLLRTHKIKKIKATSYDADNTVTEGFGLEEEISMDGKRIILTTANAGRSSITNRFYELSKLKRTQSVNNGIDNKTEYTYNEKGQIQKILFTTTDTAMKSTLLEAHDWTYNETGQPKSMLKIKNKTDTTVIDLVKDEQGLVVEERWKRKNRVIETYYYYYDTNKQLTDIVRFNTRLKKLLPDFQYEYDANGHVTQMTQVTMNTASYIIWKYTYNEKGLKQNEVGFDKQRRLIGRIEYTYE